MLRKMAPMFFLRHFETSIDSTKPASEWRLPQAGKSALEGFLQEDFLSSVKCIFSSPEPKALQAADLVAESKGIELKMDEDLREMERGAEGFIEDDDVYTEMVKQYFRRPEIPFAWENRSEVEHRIRRFLDSLNANGVPTLVISHGIILSIMLAPIFQIDPFEFWVGLDFGEVVRVDSKELEQHWQ